MQNVQVLRLEATQLVNQLPIEALQQVIDVLKSLSYQEELDTVSDFDPIKDVIGDSSDSENANMNSSEARLASSRSWSDIPDKEFNQLLRDVYEQRRMQNSQTEKPKPKSNGPTMAEMLEWLRIINEEEPIDLEIPPRVNRPVDFSFFGRRRRYNDRYK